MRRYEASWFRSGTMACLALLVVGGPAVVDAQAPTPPDTSSQGPLRFRGMCDASAVIVSPGGTLLVGEDRGKLLIVYPEAGGQPSGRVGVARHLRIGGPQGAGKTPIEGAARVGDLIYWITSHARTPRGRLVPTNARFFALRSKTEAGGESVRPYERSYMMLAQDLEKADPLGISAAIASADPVRPDLAPEKGGLDIQGLAAARDGRGLLLGLRAPLHAGKALVIPFQNPDRVMLGMARAAFGKPIQLDLAGGGVASLEWVPGLHSYFVVAAPPTGAKGSWKLYRWSGDAGSAPVFVQDVDEDGLRPEALAASPDGRRLVLLSDDGDHLMDVSEGGTCHAGIVGEQQCPCWRVPGRENRQFRGRWIDVELPGAAEIAKPSSSDSGDGDRDPTSP